VDDLRVLLLASLCSHHGVHASDHSAEFLLKLNHLDDTFFEDFREIQKSKSVARWSSIENNELKVICIQVLQNLTERSGLINTGNTSHDLGHKTFALLLHLLGHAFHSLTTLSWAEHGSETSHATVLIFTWVNLNGEEVFESIDLCWLTAKLLIKCITQVVCWISRDNENIFPVLGHFDGDAA